MNNRYASYDTYGFRYLPFHLSHSGQVNVLREILSDFYWLEAKLGALATNDLVVDYELLPDDAELRPLQDALRLSASILDQEKIQLPAQLFGRLMTTENITVQTLLGQARQSNILPWLCPLTPSLTPPGGALLRTLRGHSYQVNAVAVTPDRYAISASSDQTLKMWNLEDGAELLTLSGHTDLVVGIAVTPDGQRAISTSEDHTLKVWDLQSGKESYTLNGHSGMVYTMAMTPDGKSVIFGGQHEAKSLGSRKRERVVYFSWTRRWYLWD